MPRNVRSASFCLIVRVDGPSQEVVPTTYIINCRHLPAQRFVYCQVKYDMRYFILCLAALFSGAIFHCYFISISLQYHCDIIAISFLFHCDIIVISLLFYCYFISISFLFLCDIIAISFLFYCNIIAILLLFHFHFIAISLRFYCYFIPISLRFHSYPMLFQGPGYISKYRKYSYANVKNGNE
jgi:hypothetical protein